LFCHQLINQALEITQNENLRLSLQQLLDKEYGSGETIDLTRMTTEDVSPLYLCLSLVSLTVGRSTSLW
jgi:uncharacterized membrane protein YheB (UPF0754 family)